MGMKKASRWLGVLPGIVAAVVFFAVGAGPAAAHPDCSYIELSDEAYDCLQLGEAFEIGEWELLDDVPGGDVAIATASFTKSDNLTPLGYSARVVPTSGTGNSVYNSDPAYQDGLVYQGHYGGWRVIDVSDATNPTQLLNYTGCGTAGQGDVIVFENILVRAWDAPATQTCGGQSTGTNFEGVHIFDVSDPRNPVLLQQIRMASTGSGPFVPGGTLRNAGSTTNVGCGSHTLSLVPDPARGNIYVYSSASSGSCTGIDIIRIPLADPGNSGIVRRAGASRQCHDTTIHMGTGRVACAGGNGWSSFTFDLGLPADAPGGVENPAFVRSQSVGISTGHSHAFSNDGSTLIFGHEPGGGSQAQCQATSSTTNKTLFFYDPITAAVKGTYVQPRPQTAQENCTWHNFNVVPTNRADIAVIGSYQMGITVIDFTNLSSIQQIAFADPAPLSPTSLVLGGDWSTYWFNGKIYESDIRRGLIVWELDDRRVQGAKTTGRWNAQTQTFFFEKDRTKPRIEHSLPAAVGLNRSVAASYACVDDQGDETSDIWSCEGTVDDGANLDTSSVGTKSFTIRAEDGAGNVETLTTTYEVIWDEYAGFFRPIGDENSNRAGSAVPVKFSLGGNYGLDVLAAGYPKSKACAAADSTATSTVSSEPFTYLDGQYKYVWKTDKAWGGTCRELIVQLRDNTVHRATFNLQR
jgi:hypothetical protein